MDNQSIGASIVDDLLSTPDQADANPVAPPPEVSQPEPKSIGATLVDEMLNTSTVEDNISYRLNSGTDAERQADALRFSKLYNIPVGVAYRQLEDIQKTYAEQENAAKRSESPSWGTLLTNAEVGAIAQDPRFAPELQIIEKSFKDLPGLSHSTMGDLAYGWDKLVSNRGMQGVANAAADLQRVEQGNDPMFSSFSPFGMPAPRMSPDEQKKKLTSELARAGQTVVEAERNAALHPQSRAMRDWEGKWGENDSAFRKLLQNPQIIVEMSARNLPQSIPGIVLGGVGAATGGPAGMAAGTFAGSREMEFSSTIFDELSKRGVDFNDPQSVMDVWRKDGEKILRRAEIRGNVVGLYDALSALVGGKIAEAGLENVAGGTVKKKVLEVLGMELLGIGNDMLMGGAGEIAATAATGDPIDYKAALDEVIGEVFSGAVQTSTSIFTEARAARAENRQKSLIELGDRLRNSKIAKVSPETIAAHAEQMEADGTAPSMSAPAEGLLQLFQSEGLTPEQVQEQFPEVAAALQEAGETNAEVPLKPSTVVRLAQMQGFSELTGDIRIGQEPTAKEAARDLEDLNQTLESMSEEDKVKAVDASLQAQLVKDLVATGMEPRVAEANARMHVATMSNLAGRLRQQPGVTTTTEDLMRQFPLQIRGGEDIPVGDNETTLAQRQGYGEPAIRIGDRVFKASDYFPNWQRGSRPEAGRGTMSIADEQALDDVDLGPGMPEDPFWGHTELMRKAREEFGREVVDSQLDQNAGQSFGFVNAAGDYKSIEEVAASGGISYSKSGEGNLTAYQLNGFEIIPPGIAGETSAQASDQVMPGGKPTEDGNRGASALTRNIEQVVGDFKTNTLFQSADQAASEEDGAPPVETPGEPVPEEAVTVASLEAANNLSKSRVWETGRQLKLALQRAVLAAVKGMNLLERTAENRAYLVNVGVKDALAALAQNANAIGWYDLKTRQALAVMSLVHPELATDETSRFAFTWALATTSNGIKVDKNFELAEMVYARWKASHKDPAKRKMPTDIKAGKAQKPINKSLQLFNDLSEAWGLTPLRLFMLSNFKAGDIKAMTGIMPTGEWAKTDVRGASVIGPKIGNGFFSNLYGKFDALTMDRWLVRTWGRWTGTLIEIDQVNVDKSRVRLREAVKGLDRDALIAAIRAVTKTNKKGEVSEIKPGDRENLIKALRALQFGKGKGVLETLSDNAIDALSDAILRASQEPKFREAMNEVKGGEELRKAGNSLAKYLDGQKEQPEGPGERVYIREIFGEMLDELRQDPRYADLTMSDLQAVLWYAEKRLYETAKEDLVASDIAELDGDEVAGYDDDEAPDYANAAAAVARTKGVSDRRINAALKKEENRGRSEDAQPGAGSAGSEGSVQAGQGQQGQARGFTESERREFVQRRALDRVRSNRSGDAQSSWSYAGGSGSVRSGSGLLKKVGKVLGAKLVDVWTPGKGLKQVFNRADIKTPDIFELETGSAENAARFVSAISEARTTLGAIGEAVKVYSSEEYAGMRLFLTADAKGGFALKPDGDIVSVFSAKGEGNGRAVMETAIAAGGKKLDCFHTILPEFYSAHGFRGTSRLLWNDEIAMAEMPNWDKTVMGKFNKGEPDVVFMAYDPAYKGSYDPKATKLFDGDPDNDYGRALTAQEKVIKQVAKAPSPGPSSSQETTLLQKGQSSQTFARGSLSFTAARDQFVLTLTSRADFSTFSHEAGHYYLEVLQALVASGQATPQMAKDLETLRQWMKLEPNAKIERVHHEKFARGWEAYLMEGRAPSAELQGIFNRFRAWMVFVYKSIKALNVDLNDEVRNVMDRLVASDEAIGEARTQIGWGKPLPKEALYLDDEEYDRYVEAWNRANEAQQREIDNRLMLEAAREQQVAWKEERRKLFDEEQKKVAETRGWRAWLLLSEGKGLEDFGRTELKIDPATVPGEWSNDARGMTAEGGMPLDVVAELLGFKSGEEMLSVVAGAKAEMKQLPAKVKTMMEERHGVMDAAALADLANAAVHSDETQEVLLTEFRAMASKAGIRSVPTGLAKWMAAQASQRMLSLTRRQLDASRWRRAELKAAKDSAAAAAKGDMTKAAVHKRQQMMAAAMYRASTAADKRIKTIRDKLVPFTKNDRRAKLGKAGDMYLDAIDEILEGVQLKAMSATSVLKLDRLEKLVQEADAKGEPLVLPDKLRAMLGRKNFADMTLEELEGVHDAVMNIWHLAKTKNELRARKETRDLDQALTEMEANAAAAIGKPAVQKIFVKGWKDKATAKMRELRAGLTKMEFLFGWLDGQTSGGLMHRLIYQPIADANKAKFDLLRRYHETIIKHMRNLPAEQRARWEAKRTFLGNPTANGATFIAAALNLGNESNKKKLLAGYKMDTPEGEARFMSELNAFMTKADWDFVQHIWNEIETLWPHIEKVTKAATGLPPEKIARAPVVTPFGTYEGGYYPVVYDPEQTEQQFKNQQQGEGLFSNNFVRPTLGDGFTKARVDYAAPLLLDLSVISTHLSEVVHYVTHYEAVTQADKITRHPRFQALVKQHMGEEFYRTIRPWLQDIARDQDTPAITKQEPFAKAMKWLRGGTSVAAMGYNIYSGVKQLIGIVQSLDAVKTKFWLSGITKAWASPNVVQNWKEALDQSQELRPLFTQFDRDIKMINDTYARQGVLTGVHTYSAYAFQHIGWLQACVNVATFIGARDQALSEGLDLEHAIMRADAVVRMTQSSGSIKDLAPIQRGSEINRFVSMFYSWFNVLYNRLESIAKETKSVRDVPNAAKRIVILVMLSSMIEEASSRAYEAVMDNYDDGDDDKDPGYILSVLMKSADTLLGAIPLLRAGISAEAVAGGLKPELLPVGRFSTDYWRMMGAGYDLVVNGQAPSRSEVKATAKVVSTVTHIPVSGVITLLDELFGEAITGEKKQKR